MKHTNRLLSCLLTLVMLIGMISVCSTGILAASNGPLSYGPEELAAASNKVSLHTPKIVGMSMAPGGTDWYMLHGLNMNVFGPDGVPVLMSEDEITFVVHAYAPDEEPSGTFLQLNLANNFCNLTENVESSAYAEAEEMHSANYDYYYKELSYTWTLPDEFDEKVYEEASEHMWQIRVRGYNTVTTNLYYLAIMVNGEIMFEADGDRIFNASHQNASLVSAVEAPETAKPIAVKADKPENPTDYSSLVFDDLGGELAAGNYNATITFSNRGTDPSFNPNDEAHVSALSNKLLSVTLNGAGDPITVDYTKSDLLTMLNAVVCTAYDTITIPFTLAADGTVGLDITHYGVYDLLISDVTIERVLTREEKDAASVNEAIAAIGTVTEENYQVAGALIDTAEKAYDDFVAEYGQEKADTMITGVESMTAARTEYDRIAAAKAEEAKQAAIQKANDAINAIGAVDEINADNYQAKQELVTAAEAAVKELTDAYGEEILSSVTNYAIIAEAKTKIEEVILSTQYTLGDVTEDDEINASDALMALQHSVKLITLADNSFSAADVDASGVVDATDALYILQYSVKLIDAFPAEQ